MTKPCYELRLRNSGMFSIVNEVVQYLHLAKTQGYEFFIDWRHSCYTDQARNEDPWEYYFEPCFPLVNKVSGATLLPVGKPIACAKDNVITPRLTDGKCKPLLLPHDRNIPSKLIEGHIRLKPHVRQLVDAFIADHFTGVTIGLHLRGLGRDHGGADKLRVQGNKSNEIDYQSFFEPIDNLLVQHPEAKVFVCSDSQNVIDHTVDVYGEQAITYDSSRSEFGEMHANHPQNKGLDFSPYKLGLDVVVEAYLLAQTDYFIHGNSNVANFVISLNANLDSTYVYQDLSHE